MKNTIITIIILLIIFYGLFKGISYYNSRMYEYNKYMCAVNGYQSDCKTPLKEIDKLK